ncbi:MAG: hypothetical protein WC717_03695 [Candidatus Micrarchaeia archaeon]|jgi:hypothetical protein
MASSIAKGKKGSQAQEGAAAAKGGRASAQEKGICIICGEELAGTPAEPGLPIRAARKLRAIARLPEKRTVACWQHLGEACERRARYEKKLHGYRMGAALFFLLIVAGSLVFGRIDAGLFAPALIGSLLVAILPYFHYFPAFGK